MELIRMKAIPGELNIGELAYLHQGMLIETHHKLKDGTILAAYREDRCSFSPLGMSGIYIDIVYEGGKYTLDYFVVETVEGLKRHYYADKISFENYENAVERATYFIRIFREKVSRLP